MPFEFLTIFEGVADDVAPAMQRAAERALTIAAQEVAGDDYRFEARTTRRGRIELQLAIEIVQRRARPRREVTVREANERGWEGEVGDHLLLPVPYLPGERAEPADIAPTFGSLFPVVDFFEAFQRAGLPVLMRAYYRATCGEVPGLAALPDDTEAVFRSRAEILDFLVAEDLFCASYDGLRIRRVEVLDRLAQALVLTRTAAFAWKHLFGLLADVRPRCLHPYLAMLAPGSEPEGRAFLGAPESAIAGYARLLEDSSAPPRAAAGQLEPGELVPTGEFHDSSRSSHGVTGAAMLALLRSGHRRCLEIVEAFLRRACTSADDWENARYLALLADHAICARPSPHVVPIATWPSFEIVERDHDDGASTTGGLASGSATCSGCGKPLLNILRIVASDVPSWDRTSDLAIETCGDCIIQRRDPYFVRHDSNGVPSAYLRVNTPADGTNEYTCDLDELATRRSITLEPAPWSRGRLSEGGPGCYARIGGSPSWLQPPRPMTCPACDRPMTFVAQTDQVPGQWAELIMAFECLPCSIVGTTLERG
jgi:hypothetical protein